MRILSASRVPVTYIHFLPLSSIFNKTTSRRHIYTWHYAKFHRGFTTFSRSSDAINTCSGNSNDKFLTHSMFELYVADTDLMTLLSVGYSLSTEDYTPLNKISHLL